MSQTELEMEDAEKNHSDSGPNREDSKSGVVDSATGGEGENFSGAVAAKSNGGSEIGKSSNNDEGQAGVDNPVEDKIDLEIQTDEQKERPDHEEEVLKSNNAKLIGMNTEEDVETASRSALENQFDTKDEVSEPKPAEVAVNERNSNENPINVVTDQKEAEGMVNYDISEKKVEEIPKEVSDFVEPIKDVKTLERAGDGDSKETTKPPVESSIDEAPRRENGAQHGITQVKDEDIDMIVDSFGFKEVQHDKKGQDTQKVVSSKENDEDIRPAETTANNIKDSSFADYNVVSTPNSFARLASGKTGDHTTETAKNVFTPATQPLMGEGDDGTPEEQALFIKEVESFYRERSMDFKQPKFYGQPLNCLKLWRAVIRSGGYDKVTALKLWRQVGESFHPPKTCTTVSWTFRIFYEKALLEFERHKTQSGELQLPLAAFPEVPGVDGEAIGYQASSGGSGSVSGRARRDSASRAMQGWHAQRLLTSDEAGDSAVKDKNLNNVVKREKNVKSSGSVKQKRPPEPEHSNKVARTETSKQLATSVVDVGPPADWVKINVRQTQDCFEVYALVPGLLREEVRVQSDPAGRVVITGQPEQVDNPWGITPFKKVVSLPERIDPLQTSAVVSMHGRLFVRVPFEQSNAQTC